MALILLTAACQMDRGPKRSLDIVGEIHGTNEMPAEIFSRVQAKCMKGTDVSLLMDLPESSQSTLDAVTSPGVRRLEEALAKDAFFQHSPDGRASQAAVKLLKDLSRLSQNRQCTLTIKAVEPSPLPDDDRKSKYLAQKTMAFANSSERGDIIAFVGRGMVADIVNAYNANQRAIHEFYPSIIHFSFDNGSSWNCSAGCCGTHATSNRADIPSPSLISDGEIGTVKLNKLTASAPWSKATDTTYLCIKKQRKFPSSIALPAE